MCRKLTIFAKRPHASLVSRFPVGGLFLYPGLAGVRFDRDLDVQRLFYSSAALTNGAFIRSRIIFFPVGVELRFRVSYPGALAVAAHLDTLFVIIAHFL